MFGSQAAALEALTAEQYEVAQGYIVDIYTAAGLHDGKKTSADALMRCVTDDVEGVAGPIEDGGGEPAGEENHEEQPEEQGETHGSKGFCCADSQDPADICGTCWPGAVIGSDDYCSASESHCSSCKLTWCGEREAEEEPPSEEEAQQLSDDLQFDIMMQRFSAGGPVSASRPAALAPALQLARRGLRGPRRGAPPAGDREALVAPE